MFVHCCPGRFLLMMGAYKSCSSVDVKALVVSEIFHIPQALPLPASGDLYPNYCGMRSVLWWKGHSRDLLQPVLHGANATEIWEPSFPGRLHTPFQAESSTLSSVIRSVFFRSRGEYFHSSFSSTRTLLHLYCLDVFVYTQAWKYTLVLYLLCILTKSTNIF